MGNKFFNKDLQKACKYCLYSHTFNSPDEVLCSKRGAVEQNDCCRKYRYDATKRVPLKQMVKGDFKPEDFLI